MVKKPNQYTVGKDNLYYFYRFVILPWEVEWHGCKFLINKGEFKSFCKNNSIDVKSFESTKKLNDAIGKKYSDTANLFKGVLWFVRVETKPKDTLRHLRNCFAHGNFKRRQKNRERCIEIRNIYNNSIKAQGFIPLRILEGFIRAAVNCKV